MKLKYLSKSSLQTQKIGKTVAKEILKIKKGPIVLGLEGELGGGKTTFLQGFAKGLGSGEKITSPTFVILKRFRFFQGYFRSFYHIDCYRIKKIREILNLNFKKIISNPQNIIAIEWSDRIKKILPKKTLIIKFNFIDKTKRRIELNYKK